MAKTHKEYKMTPERVQIILEALGNSMTQRGILGSGYWDIGY